MKLKNIHSEFMNNFEEDSISANHKDNLPRDAKKHVFFKPCFLCKKKMFFIKKNSFLMFFLFFSITGRFLINYSAIRVYL